MSTVNAPYYNASLFNRPISADQRPLDHLSADAAACI